MYCICFLSAVPLPATTLLICTGEYSASSILDAGCRQQGDSPRLTGGKGALGVGAEEDTLHGTLSRCVALNDGRDAVVNRREPLCELLVRARGNAPVGDTPAARPVQLYDAPSGVGETGVDPKNDHASPASLTRQSNICSG